MHEFSIAQNIIEIVNETAKEHHAEKVTEVVLEIGTLSGIEIPALEMALESLAPGTIMNNSKVKIKVVRAEGICCQCGEKFEPEEFYSCCPACGSFGPDIIYGKELKVLSVTMG